GIARTGAADIAMDPVHEGPKRRCVQLGSGEREPGGKIADCNGWVACDVEIQSFLTGRVHKTDTRKQCAVESYGDSHRVSGKLAQQHSPERAVTMVVAPVEGVAE